MAIWSPFMKVVYTIISCDIFKIQFINSLQVIFIDEIDSICRRRSIQEEEYTRRIKTELLKQVT